MHYFEVDPKQIDDARFELLRLAVAITRFNNVQNLPKCKYLDLHDFAEIGLKLSQIIYNTTSVFEEQFSLLVREQIMARLEENCASNLVYSWAINNCNITKEMSVNEWIKELEAYRDEESNDWSISAKKFGIELKRAAPTLRRIGIECESLGKRGSFVKWKITTAAKIELLDDIFETTNGSLQSKTKVPPESQPKQSLLNPDPYTQEDQSTEISAEEVQDISSIKQKFVTRSGMKVEVRKQKTYVKKPETKPVL